MGDVREEARVRTTISKEERDREVKLSPLLRRCYHMGAESRPTSDLYARVFSFFRTHRIKSTGCSQAF